VNEVQINWPMVWVYLFVAQWIFNIGVGVWLYFRDGDNKNAKAVTKVEKALEAFIRESERNRNDQNARVGRIEAVMEHMPTAEEVTSLRESAARAEAQIEGMNALLKRVDHQTGLIHEHLLRHH
jgi:N-glycosylase/DNA lyase